MTITFLCLPPSEMFKGRLPARPCLKLRVLYNNDVGPLFAALDAALLTQPLSSTSTCRIQIRYLHFNFTWAPPLSHIKLAGFDQKMHQYAKALTYRGILLLARHGLERNHLVRALDFVHTRTAGTLLTGQYVLQRRLAKLLLRTARQVQRTRRALNGIKTS
jgi:hypothetical protein